MADLVVTVPKDIWADWLAEGDIPGQPPGGAFDAYDFTCARASDPRPPIEPGERVYVVAHGRLRGYAPLVEVTRVDGKWSLVRAGGAVAVTIPEPVRGFRGWKVRAWDRAIEQPFPDWTWAGVKLPCCRCTRTREIVGYLDGHDPLCAWCLVAALNQARRESRAAAPAWLARESAARAIVERRTNVEEYDLLAAESQHRRG